jgi:hypothetical protein
MTFYNQLRPHRAFDARTTCVTGRPCLYGPLPRRRTPLGTTYKLADTVQTTGATVII